MFVLTLKGSCGLMNLSQMDIDQLTSYFVLNKSLVSKCKCIGELAQNAKLEAKVYSSKGLVTVFVIQFVYNSVED